MEVEIRGSWVGLYLGADPVVDFEKKLWDAGCMKTAWNQASLAGGLLVPGKSSRASVILQLEQKTRS